MPARLVNAVQPVVRAELTELWPQVLDSLQVAAVAGGLIAMGHHPATAYHVARQYATIAAPGIERAVLPGMERVTGLERLLGIPGVPTGLPGLGAVGMPGISPFAVPGISPLAAPGISPLAAPGISPFAVPGISPFAVPGISPLGMPGVVQGLRPFMAPWEISPLAVPGGIFGMMPGIMGLEVPGRAGMMAIDP